MKKTATFLAILALTTACRAPKAVEKADASHAEHVLVSEKARSGAGRQVVVVDSPTVVVQYVDSPARRVEYRAARVRISSCDTQTVVEHTAVASTETSDTSEKSEPRPDRLPLLVAVGLTSLVLISLWNRRR